MGSYTSSTGPMPIGSGIAKSIKLGERLHITLVIARPNENAKGEKSKARFPTNELLAYDIEIVDANNPKGAKGLRLADLGLLTEKDAIVYGRLQDDNDSSKKGPLLPSFFLRGKTGPLNILHGSCRKLHGKGEDCLLLADELISSTFDDLERRPSALFLTGDQVYVDDVATPLARYITELGVELLGWEELIQGVDKKPSEIQPGERQKAVKEFAGFTSGHAANHLLGFGEFAAMYMLAWNPDNWPDNFPDPSALSRKERTKYRSQVRQLEATKRDLAAVRRVLANVPTYMIFDDHEVTDDWNITKEWQDNVKASKCGKQIVANALAAYWVFQGWGNDSSSYDDNFIGRIVEYFGKKGIAINAEREAFEDFMWNFCGWTYSAPTNPLTIVADSRTQRHYDSFDGPPQLIGEDGLFSISKAALKANHKKGNSVIIAKSIKLGERLHITLVIARPNENAKGEKSKARFPTNELLAYDIEIVDANNPKGAKGLRLADLGLLTEKDAIVYGRLQDDNDSSKKGPLLPSFFLRGKTGPLNILHGSCRKLHGKGEDCLLLADELISSTFDDLERRPSALFLTGDQVYVDDVATPLARYITELGVELLGWEELIQGVDKKPSEIQPGERQKAVKEFAGFTSGHAANHLLGFGEFAAMYMLAWNPDNWPDNFPDPSALSRKERTKYRSQVRQLEATKRDLAAVRRVLANVPTYMIFDDHEVTDDWNITKEWQDNVKASKCGKQIVANALAAYWVFQGWGNDSSSYDDNFIGRIVEYFGKKGIAINAEREAFEDFMWNFCGWTYSAPTNPLTIVADSRTQRHYDSFDGPPQLIGEDGLFSISKAALKANHKKGNSVIIVSATPVLGFYLMEALQKALAKITSIYAVDVETWYANTKGRVGFLSFLAHTLAPSHCIFLSGDVHFGFAIRAAFSRIRDGYADKDNNNVMSIIQLNSSALKTTSLVKIAFVSEIMGRIRQIFPFKRIVRTGRLLKDRGGAGSRYPDWIEARAIVKASGSLVPPLIISDNNLGLVTIEENMNRIIHKLLVRKGPQAIKVHESVVDKGKSPMENAVKAKIAEMTR